MATATMSTGTSKKWAEALALAEQELRQTNRDLENENDKLADLQARRAAECEDSALGKKADPSKFDSAIRTATDRVTGLTAVRRTRERAVADAKANYFNATAEEGRVAGEKAVEAETASTQRLIGEIEDAIEARNRATRTIQTGIEQLRRKKYLLEANRRIGVDSAQRLERLSVGMRP